MFNLVVLLLCGLSVIIPGSGGEEVTQLNVNWVLEREFDYMDRLGRTSTQVGVLQGTHGEGTSSVGDPII